MRTRRVLLMLTLLLGLGMPAAADPPKIIQQGVRAVRTSRTVPACYDVSRITELSKLATAVNLATHASATPSAAITRAPAVTTDLSLEIEYAAQLAAAQRPGAPADGSELVPPWFGPDGMLKQVDGWRFPGMLEVFRDPQFAPFDGYVTDYFVQQVGWQPPAGAQQEPMWAYRYTRPAEKGTETHKGGGRDHLIGDGGNVSQYGVKGSGTNPEYSAVNGEFEIGNFRRNGLLELPETLAEQGVGLRLKAHGAPVTPHVQLALLPEPMQRAIHEAAAAGGSDAHWTRNVAVQVVRDLSVPRESMQLATLEQAARVVGIQSFFNIGHGAMAPANQAGGHFLDLGHLSFGYPGTSGLYRCTVCKGADGSTGNAPDWFLSSLAHYFPEAGSTASYASQVSREAGSAIVHEMMRVVGPASPAPSITAAELDALKLAWTEQLPFVRSVSYRNHLIPFGELLVGSPLPTDVKPHRLSMSLRTIMQVAGLRYVLPAEQADHAKAILLGMSKDEQSVETLYDMFVRTLASTEPTRTTLRPLYDQEIPTNVLIERLDARLSDVAALDMPGVQNAAEQFLEHDIPPNVVSPEQFLDALEDAFGHTSPAFRHALVLGGGGMDVDGFRRVIALAGGPKKAKVVVITAAADGGRHAGHARSYTGTFGALGASATWIPVHEGAREVAYDAAMLDKVRESNVVFFGGGSQNRLIGSLNDPDGKPTPLLALIQERFRNRELIIAGDSAGAASQAAGPAITSGDSYEALTQPSVPTEDIYNGVDLSYNPRGGLGFFPFAVDTHFAERGREGRLLQFAAETNQPLAFGIDEGTAIVLTHPLEPERRAVRVVGQGGVAIFDLHGADVAADTITSVSVSYLNPGDIYWPDARRAVFAPERNTNGSAFEALASAEVRALSADLFGAPRRPQVNSNDPAVVAERRDASRANWGVFRALTASFMSSDETVLVARAWESARPGNREVEVEMVKDASTRTAADEGTVSYADMRLNVRVSSSGQ